MRKIYNTYLETYINKIEIINGQKTINDNVYIVGMDLTKLPDFSDITINGDFSCSCNNLTSLTGSPKIITNTFICSNNELTSFDNAPRYVGGLWCTRNKFISLRGAPISTKQNIIFYSDQFTALQYENYCIEETQRRLLTASMDTESVELFGEMIDFI